MKSSSIVSTLTHPKRLCGGLTLLSAMIIQSALPAYATVAQAPVTFTAPPDVNVMFTLDDSGSMRNEAIPDESESVDHSMWSGGFQSGSNSFTAASANAQRQKYLSTSAKWRYYRSSAGNPLYYNPEVRYDPWPFAGDDTQRYGHANPAAACYYPDTLPVSGITTPNTAPACVAPNVINLRDRVNVTGGANANDHQDHNYWPATYFRYLGTEGTLVAGTSNQLPGINTETNFQKVEIKPEVTSYPKGGKRTDCLGETCTYAEELRNFANWFTYYRSRALMAKGAVALAFSKQGTNVRVGYATLHGAATNVDSVNTPLIKLGVRKFDSSFRPTFYARLYSTGTTSGTPLRYAADTVGKYFQRTGVGSPWALNPGATQRNIATEYACRKSFHILTTDGYWNTISEGALSTISATEDDDFSGQTAPPKPDGTSSTFSNTNTDKLTVDPFRGSANNTLSDYVAKYWVKDLQTESHMANSVPVTTQDPAYWQHLTTYTVGIGISSGMTSISTDKQREALIKDKTYVAWTNPGNGGDSPSVGDDLVHAAMTGRGKFFLALRAEDFANDLAATLNELADQTRSSVNLEASSKAANAGNLYQATYNQNGWYGRLYAYAQSSAGTVSAEPEDAAWEASSRMPAPADRRIYTWNAEASPASASLFEWGSLSASQRSHLNNDSTVLDYLRGSNARERNNDGPFRNRVREGDFGGVLGDIINSSPVKGPDAGGAYENMRAGAAGQSTYALYRSQSNASLDDMRNTLFVGANDGMLHAFNAGIVSSAEGGVERFAYVPNSVYNVRVAGSASLTERKLLMLSDLAYQHRYTVDGGVQIGDAFFGTGQALVGWRTVLAASTGAGARSVFAIDVTNPTPSTNGFGPRNILWEFSDSDATYGSDMGFVLPYPHIARMRVGDETRSVAIFGNGYDSASGYAALFILDLETGAVIKRIRVGSAGGNGLSQPNFVVNAQREILAIYAGDLRGNLWKFNISTGSGQPESDPDRWVPAFGSAPGYVPLFTTSNNQPITVMPEISFHTSGGAMVSFGTGKSFGPNDGSTNPAVNVNLSQQAIYGIWDKPGETTGFSGLNDLVAQSLDSSRTAVEEAGSVAGAERSFTGSSANAIDWTTKRGWYLNLSVGVGAGERVDVNPLQVIDVLFVVANTPTPDPCRGGGSARVFAFNPMTGGAPSFAVYDINNDASFNSSDRGYNVRNFATVLTTVPLIQAKRALPNAVTTAPQWNFRGQTAAQAGGVELKTTSKTDCTGRVHQGDSDAGITSTDVNLCDRGVGRISWRQLK